MAANGTQEQQYQQKEQKRKPLLIDVFQRLIKEKPLGTIGGVIVLLLFVTAIFANLIAPYGENQIMLADRLMGPSGTHWLGTDNLGRDLFSRIVFGARISMYVGLGGAIIHVVLATFIGLISGYLGGKFDLIVQRFVDAFMCIPQLFLVLTIMAVVGPGLIQIILVLGVSGGIRGSRLIRSAVIGIKENIYVEAAKAVGAGTGRVLWKHILPNVTAVVIIAFTLAMGNRIMMEATLSFLGFGVPPPAPSWGGMLSGSGRKYMILAPWMCLWPGLTLAMVIYGINMLGDALRDLMDPRLRGGLGRYAGVREKMEKKLKKVTEE